MDERGFTQELEAVLHVHHRSPSTVIAQTLQDWRTTIAFQDKETRITAKTAQALAPGMKSNHCSAKTTYTRPVSCLKASLSPSLHNIHSHYLHHGQYPMFWPYVSHTQKSMSFRAILGKHKSIKVFLLAPEHLQGTDGNCSPSSTILTELSTTEGLPATRTPTFRPGQQTRQEWETYTSEGVIA